MTTTTNINAKSFVDYYTDWKFPNKTDADEPARIDCKYDFAVTLSNGALLTAIGALVLGVLRVMSPMLALALVGVSAIVYWQMNEKVHSMGSILPDKEGTVDCLAYDVSHKYRHSDHFDKEKPWNHVAYNIFDRIAFYRYAPKPPAPKKAEQTPVEAPKGRKAANVEVRTAH